MSCFGKFLRRSASDRRLVVEAFLLLSWTKLVLRVAPFRWIAPRLGRTMAESPECVEERERQIACQVAWAVGAVVGHAPFKYVCLPQAIAAKWMLRRRGVASTLYLGLQKSEGAPMTAHAWLRVGDRILTGRAESLNHKAIATFAESVSGRDASGKLHSKEALPREADMKMNGVRDRGA